MSARPGRPFSPNDAQREWLRRFDGSSAYIPGARITIAELHELLDAGLLVLSKSLAGYSRAQAEPEMREAV